MKKILLATTALVAAASPAHAGPLAAAAAWVGGVLAGGGIAAFAMNMALSVGLSLISQALMPKPEKPKTQVNFDVQMGDDLPLSFVVGDYATAGKRKYIQSWGVNTRLITEVIEVSALPQGLAAMWVNDEIWQPVEGQRGYVPEGNPDSAEWIGQASTVPAGNLDIGQPLQNHHDDDEGNHIYVKWVDGTQAAADPFLVWAFGGRSTYPWTADMVGRGKSYAIITTRYDFESLTSYPTFLFQPAPKPFYDLRFDSTNGGSGTQRWDDPATWQPTRNPAVIAYNIVRGIYYGSEWVFGGKNLPAWRLPSAEWIAAANACDAPVTLAGGGTEPRYRCGMEITVDMEPASVLEEIGKAANMRFAEVGGRLKPIVDLPGAAVLGITDGDILITEGQSFRPFFPVSETFNTISATYPEPGEKWTTKDAAEYVDTAAKAKHGDRHLPVQMTYPAVPYAAQVQRLMRSQMRDYGRQRQHEFYLPPDAYGLEPGIDLVSFGSARNGYDAKLFVVERVARVPGMNVLVSLREVEPADYDWSSSFEQPVVITPPLNPVPFVQPIRGLTVTGEIVRDAANNARRPAILVACDGDEEGVTHIEIQRRLLGQMEIIIEPLRPFVAPFQWHIFDVIPGQTYDVRARLISDMTPLSEWSGWIAVAVPDVRLGTGDVDVDAIVADVREDVDDLEQWAEGADTLIGAIQTDIAGLDTLTGQLQIDLSALDTGLAEEILIRQTADEGLALQIQTLTANITSENLLENPLFTEGADGLDGWTTTNGPSVVARDAGSTDPLIANAPSAVFVSLPTPTAGWGQITQRPAVEFEEGEQVRWSLHAGSAVARSNARLLMRWYDATDTPMGVAIETTLDLPAGEWKHFSGTLAPPTGAASLNWIAHTYPGTGLPPVYVASPSVKRIDPSVVAQIVALEAAVANNEQALASLQTTLTARFEANETNIAANATQLSNRYTKAEADAATSGAINAYDASITDGTNTGTANVIEAVRTHADNAHGRLDTQAETLTLVNAKTDRASASGLLRIAAEATPTGAQSRIGIRAEASAGDTSHSAAFYLVANTNGTSQAIFDVGRFAIANSGLPNAPKTVPFIVQGGVVYIDTARIREATIDTLHLATGALVTGMTASYDLTASVAVQTATRSVVVPAYSAASRFVVLVNGTDFSQETGIGNPGYTVSLHCNGVTRNIFWHRTINNIALDGGGATTIQGQKHFAAAPHFSPAAGNNTVTLTVTTEGANTAGRVYGTITVLELRKSA